MYQRLSGGALCALAILLLAGCDRRGEKGLKDLSWGTEIDGDFDTTVDRAQWVLSREFPKGLDPDRSDPDGGIFYTVWHYKPSAWYRDTTRTRAQVRVEPSGKGKVRVGVAVVQQINDNIDNPSEIDEARWVNTHNVRDRELLLEKKIARRYTKLAPSEYWQEKHRGKSRGSLRPDLVDKYQDVSMGNDEEKRVDEKGREMPASTGVDQWGDRWEKNKNKK